MRDTDFSGVYAKIHRAEKHINNFKYAADTLCNEAKKNIERQVSADVDEQRWVYRGPTPEVPIEWSVVIGEILYNLRSALDHLVWQLVVLNGEIPGRHNEFPIAADHEAWERQRAHSLKGVSQRHQDLIVGLQPFSVRIGVPIRVSRLKVLDDLCNVEKHRHLVAAVVASTGIDRTKQLALSEQLELSSAEVKSPLAGIVPNVQVTDGAVLARFNNPDSPLNVDFQVDVRLGGEQQPLTSGLPLPTMLEKHLLKTVKGVVGIIANQ